MQILTAIVKLLSAYYRKQIVFLHYTQYCLWILIYSLSFKPYLYSAVSICSVIFFLTFSYLLSKWHISICFVFSFQIRIVTTTRYLKKSAHLTYDIFFFMLKYDLILNRRLHFLSVSERKSRINSFSISNYFIFESLRAIMYFSSLIFISSVIS